MDIKLIESKDNVKIKNAIKISKDASYRRKNDVFFASTPKVVMDLLAFGFKAEMLFFVFDEYDKYQKILPSDVTYVITNSVSEKLSEDKTSQGVFGVFKMKKPNINKLFKTDKLLVLEDVQDPNNMGAIMRTALAFGFEDVVISGACADVYSQKVIRTSMTASAKLNVYRVSNLTSFIRDIKPSGIQIVAACLQGAENLEKVSIKKPIALMIGNEGNGLSDEVISLATKKVKIPMSEDIESLNAAVSAAILMWEFK